MHYIVSTKHRLIIKRYATRVSPQLANRLIDGARSLLNSFTSDVSYANSTCSRLI
jgi:hypothetical protein